jgi:hypothetical protein
VGNTETQGARERKRKRQCKGFRRWCLPGTFEEYGYGPREMKAGTKWNCADECNMENM